MLSTFARPLLSTLTRSSASMRVVRRVMVDGRECVVLDRPLSYESQVCVPADTCTFEVREG